MSTKTKVSKLLTQVDEDTLKVLVEHSKPNNRIMGNYLKEITEWKFCDVLDLGSKDTNDIIPHILGNYIFSDNGDHVSLTESDLSKAWAKEFLQLLKFIQLEFKKVATLMEQLKSDPDPDMESAGIKKMDPFGIVGIYYAIDKNPLSWDAISEVEFGKMYTKLMIDKIQSDIQKEHARIINDKQQRKNKR